MPPSRIAQAAGNVDALVATLCEAKRRGDIRGGFVLATCNRIELVVDREGDPIEWARRLLDPSLPYREARGEIVVERLLRIATGLESLVLGEEQILGQLARAFQTAEEAGLLSKTLHMVRTRVLAAARSLRAEMPSAGPAPSVASLGVEQLLDCGGRIGVLGAGQTARLVLEILQRRKRPAAVVINRTRARAEALAAHFGAQAMSLDEFAANPPQLDGLICAVDSRAPIVGLRQAQGLRVLVDLSRPAVYAQELRGLEGLAIVDLDRLAELSCHASEAQQRAAELLSSRVKGRAARICEEASPGRSELANVVDLHLESARAEIDKAFRGKLEHLGDRDRELVRQLLERAAKRHAHYHLLDLKQLGATR